MLVSEFSIFSNLRRAASKGLFSCLNQQQLNDLALRHFGIYKNDKLIGYECPYSGKKITNVNDLVLEHIIPVSSGGGTALFNCIPTSYEVNSISEKGSKHLINWWLNSKYWNDSAPIRLEKIIKYMLEAYEITFINCNEVSNDVELFDEDETNNDREKQECDLSTTQEEEQDIKDNSLITYYNFINELIEELKMYKDVTIYQSKLQNLINENIFENIERKTMIQKALKDILKKRLELEDRSELSLVLNVDVSRLDKSLETISNENIYSEIERRIDNLAFILKNNNLSLNSLFMDKNSINYLYKNTRDLTIKDIKELIENINMCVTDKYNTLVQFIKDNEGRLPLRISASNEIEKKLARFLESIKAINKKNNKFSIKLKENQLKGLHDSEYKTLRDIYKEILFKAVKNGIEIEYIDEKMNSKIREYNELSKSVHTIEEQVKLETEYIDYIVIESQFNQLINFVLNTEPKGILPSRSQKADEVEKQLANFLQSIKIIDKKNGKYYTQLTKDQLRYLHDSEYKTLRDIYKELLFKAVVNNIEIEYMDEEMTKRIREYNELLNNVSSIEEQIELENAYKECIIIENPFNQLIKFVSNTEPKGILPSKSKYADELEIKLANFTSSIKNVKQKKRKFQTQLTKEQLRYLRDSEYKNLRRIYEEIIEKATMINYQPYIEVNDEISNSNKGKVA